MDHLGTSEPGVVKTAYRTLFKRIVAEPDLKSGTMKLIFEFNIDSADCITEQEKVSVTKEVVGAQGLEPRIHRL